MPSRRQSALTADEPSRRPSGHAARKANMRQILQLFHAYRARLAVVCALIVLSAGNGVVSPFLLREVLNVAIPDERSACSLCS